MIRWPWFGLSALIVLIDGFTKQLALRELIPYQPYEFWPMLNFTLAYNTGAAFSFLSNTGDWHRWLFTGFSSLMCIVLVLWILRVKAVTGWYLSALALILGGAIGNLLDRFIHGHVIDFIDFYYKTHHWYVFNIADSAICVGAFLLIFIAQPSKQ